MGNRGRPKKYTESELTERKAASKKRSRERLRDGTQYPRPGQLSQGEEVISLHTDIPENQPTTTLDQQFAEALDTLPLDDGDQERQASLDTELAEAIQRTIRISSTSPRPTAPIRLGHPSRKRNRSPSIDSISSFPPPGRSAPTPVSEPDPDSDDELLPLDRLLGYNPHWNEVRAVDTVMGDAPDLPRQPSPSDSLPSLAPTSRHSTPLRQSVHSRQSTPPHASTASWHYDSEPTSPVQNTTQHSPAAEDQYTTPGNTDTQGEPTQAPRRAGPQVQAPDLADTHKLASFLAEFFVAPQSIIGGVNYPGDYARERRPGDRTARPAPENPEEIVPGQWFRRGPPNRLSMSQFLDQWAPLTPTVIDMTSLKTGHDLPDTTPNERKQTFCGFTRHPRERPFLSISIDQAPDSECRTYFDLDSYVALAKSLAVITTGLKVICIQRPLPSIQASLHLGDFAVSYHDEHGRLARSAFQPLHKIPQVTIGRCAGNDDLEVIVFFPHAVREKQQIAKLTDEIFTEWMDVVFLPALNDVLPPVQSRTLPINHEMAKAQSLFRSQNLITASNESRRQYLAYRIQAEYLDDIWQQILRRLRAAPHGYLFQEPLLMVNARGIKGATSASTWRGMRAKMDTVLTQHINPEFINLQYRDIGREYSRSVSVDGDQSGDVPVYTLKYLREVARKIMNIFPENENKVADYHEYPQYFLSGCGTMTIEPLPGSKLALHGLIFGQSYNTVKDVFAAGDNYLASNRAVDDLGLDPTKIQALQSAAQAISDGQKSASAQALINVFLYLLKYVDNLTSAGSRKSFSTRDELRLRDDLWQVFDRLMFALEDHFGATVEQQSEHPEGSPEGLLIQRVSRPGTQLYRPGTNAVLRLQTSLFLNWVKWNVNRLAFGVCFIFSDTAPGEAITWEQARATATFYRAIAVFLGTTLPGTAYRYWEDRLASTKDRHGRVDPEPREGFGFRLTMNYCGFPWFMDKFDWTQLVYRPEVSHLLPFLRFDIETRFRRHFRRVYSAHDLSQRIELCAPSLRRLGRDFPACRSHLFMLFHQICALQFRRAVFQHLADNGSLNDDDREVCVRGDVALSPDNLVKVLKRGRQGLVFKHDGKSKLIEVENLLGTLFGFDNHERIEKMPYVHTFRTAWFTIERKPGVAAADDWAREFYSYLRATTWVFPYPQNNRFMNRSQDAEWHADGKPWLFWADNNRRIEAAQRRNGGYHVPLPLPQNWKADYIGHWYNRGIDFFSRMRGTPALDHDLILQEPADFLNDLVALAGEDAEDDPDDEDYDTLADERHVLTGPIPSSSLPTAIAFVTVLASTNQTNLNNRRPIHELPPLPDLVPVYQPALDHQRRRRGLDDRVG